MTEPAYYEIGQRIRLYRKALRLSQEQLAEAADISVTHMSHIETGNTKLSLPVLILLAEALHVTLDDLVYGRSLLRQNTELEEFAALLESCTPEEARIITETSRALRAALRRN